MDPIQKFMFLILLVRIQYVKSDNYNLRLDPLVDANAGLIRGLRARDGDYSMFLGIPFAKVDKSNPFGFSTPQEKFPDIYDAYDDSLMLCPQFSTQPVGNLNCLRLNVYVPNSASSKNLLPVMIWIHGGAFMRGSGRKSEYGPKYLLKQNVILVTINYRVGPYGFMCLDIPAVPGNQGMKDQLLALRWIQDNIQAFGGDINKITLFGESAGAISVDLHLLSLHDKLFNKVIMQSGSSLASTVIEEPNKLAPMKLAEYLGFKTTSISEALNFLAQTDSDLVIAASIDLNMIYKPCKESKFDDVDSFITEHWIGAKMPKVEHIPILIGFNNKERWFEYVNKSPENFSNLNVIHDKLVQTFAFHDDQLAKMENIIQNFYMGDKEMDIKLKSEIGNFDSDYTYIHPIQRSIRKYIESSAENIFQYMFSYNGKRNFMKISLNITGIDGAFHADELGYLFDIPNFPEDNEHDLIIIEQMTEMWANFAKYSDPTPTTSDILPVKWISLTEEKWHYLNIDSELLLGSRPLNERMAFWDLFYILNKQSQKGLKENLEIRN